MSYFFHPDALFEHKESAKFYEAQRRGLGKSYVLEIERAAKEASQHPNRFQVVHGNSFRKVKVKKFPYSIFFRESAGSVQLLAIAHNRREPGYWQNRI